MNLQKLKYFFGLPTDIWQIFIGNLPGPIGFFLRHRFWKKRLMFLGKSTKIDIGAHFQNPHYISIGDSCWIDRGVIIMAGPDRSGRPRRVIPNADFPIEKGMVSIGNRVHISPYCVLSGIGGLYVSDECGIASGSRVYSFSNHYRSDEFPSDQTVCFTLFVEPSRQYMIEGPVFLDLNVGLAANVTVLPGVSIKKNSFVVGNSIVMSSFPENSLIAGTPAKQIAERFKATTVSTTPK